MITSGKYIKLSPLSLRLIFLSLIVINDGSSS
jgi:hypothetical protein